MTTATVTTSSVDSVIASINNKLADSRTALSSNNSARQTAIRNLFDNILNKTVDTSVIRDEKLFSCDDINFYLNLYQYFLSAKSRAFPIGVTAELAQLKHDREILTKRGDDLLRKDLERYMFLLKHAGKLNHMLQLLDTEIYNRKIAQAEKLAEQAAIRKPVTPVVGVNSPWEFERKISKSEVVSILGGEDKLEACFASAQTKGSHVVEVVGETERISYRRNGASVQYTIERKVR